MTPLIQHNDSLLYTFECFRHWSPFYSPSPVRIPLADNRFAHIRPFSFLRDALWQPHHVEHVTISTQNWFDSLRIIQKLRTELVVIHFETPTQPVVELLTTFTELNAELDLVRAAWLPVYKPYNSWCVGMNEDAYLTAHLTACRYHPQLAHLFSQVPDVIDYGRGVCWEQTEKRYLELLHSATKQNEVIDRLSS